MSRVGVEAQAPYRDTVIGSVCTGSGKARERRRPASG
jgi:hypothetical protein